MRYAPLAVAIIAASCGGRKTDRAPEPTPVPGQPPIAPQVALPAAPPPFPEGTHSLELVRTVGVRLEPADDAKQQYRPVDELFHWPLSLALLLALGALAPLGRARRLEWAR